MKMTHSMKPADVTRDWFVVDATDIPLGRLASVVALRLRGKHKPTFTPHVDGGDHIVVINAEKVKLTGNKAQNMEFRYHTGYVGGLKTIIAGQERDGKHPERLIKRAVERMLPKDSPLARQMFTKLHVYKGAEHPHAGQQPKELKLGAKEGVR